MHSATLASPCPIHPTPSLPPALQVMLDRIMMQVQVEAHWAALSSEA